MYSVVRAVVLDPFPYKDVGSLSFDHKIFATGTTTSAGTGTVYSYSVMRVAKPVFVIGYVELDEAIRDAREAYDADAERRWRLDGAERPEVEGCLDIDLNFSPSTNLLPIRRLDLAVGEQASVRAAWLRFPSFSLEPLQQRYHRLDGGLYRYESGGGRFTADLLVDESGFVTRYPGVWEAEGNG